MSRQRTWNILDVHATRVGWASGSRTGCGGHSPHAPQGTPRGPLQWPHRHRWAAPGHSGSRFGAWGRTDGVTRAGQFPSGQMGCFLISVPLQDSGKWRKKENQQQAPRTLCHTQLLERRGFWGSPHPTTPAHHAQQPTSGHQASSSWPLTPVSTREEGPSFQTPPCRRHRVGAPSFVHQPPLRPPQETPEPGCQVCPLSSPQAH